MSKYNVGLRNVGSYQVSGIPFMTGSTIAVAQEYRVDFPYVTKRVVVRNQRTSGTGKVLQVHFQSTSSLNGGSADVLNHGHVLGNLEVGESISLDVKCSHIYITVVNQSKNCPFQCFAELTQIPTGSMYVLTGSGITE
jgi:hypothetical protein